MSKLLLVGGPLALYAVTVLVRWGRGRRPTRHAMNVEVAILLTLYFVATASLGLFWVANQQLPPFDLHYLFGYATLALVGAHLAYNARIVIAYARRVRGRARPTADPAGRDPAADHARTDGTGAGRPHIPWPVVGGAALAIASFTAGTRCGAPRVILPGADVDADERARSVGADGAGAHRAAVEAYHAMSSHTRSGVVLRAPSVAWTLPVAPTIDRGDAPRISLPVRARRPPRPASGAIGGAPRDPDAASARATGADPRTPGAAASANRGAPGSDVVRPDLEAVATIVWAAAGITQRRGGFDLRASASSGALFPTEIYVIAFDVDGLAPGTYAYAPDEHALVDLARPAEASPLLGLDPGAPPALALVATSVFRRTGQKYRDRAYRYVLADAGHVLGSAIVAAGEVGLVSRLVPGFDDAALARAIGVDGTTEGTVALVTLETPRHRDGVDPTRIARDAPRRADRDARRRADGSRSTAAARRHTIGGAGTPAEAAPLVPGPLTDAASLELGATSMVHLATSLAAAAPVEIAPPRARQPDAAAVALPALDDHLIDALSLIAARRSVRRFDAGPIALADVAAVLRLAAVQPPFASRATDVYLVASRVDGLAPGAYRLDVDPLEPDAMSLVPRRAGDLAAEAGGAALDQDAVGLAPAVIVITARRDALLADGPRGYRHAFLDAGVVGARLYLAAGARGLAGCSVGAFYDDEAARLLGIELEQAWPLHFFALGAPSG